MGRDKALQLHVNAIRGCGGVGSKHPGLLEIVGQGTGSALVAWQ